MKTVLVCYRYCCILFNLFTGVIGVTCSFGSVSYIDEPTCYWLTTQPLSNTLSNDECKRDGGLLANILDLNAWNVLTTQMQNKGETIDWYSGIWIGITDQQHEGSFKTMKGADQSWFKWKTGEPSDVSHSFNCVKLLPKDPVEPFTYDDRDCSEDSIALCYLQTESTTSSIVNSSQTESSSMPFSALSTETVPPSTDVDIQTTDSSVTSYISDSISTNTESTQAATTTATTTTTTTTATTTTPTTTTTTTPTATSTTGYVSSHSSNIDTSQLSSNNYAPSTGYSNTQTTRESFPSTSIVMATSVETLIYEEGTTASPLITSGVSAIVTDENYNHSCLCVCKTFGLSAEELQRRIQEIVETLTIPKKSTSASRRRLISAPDDRASARSLGYFGAAILVTVAGFIVFLDMTSVYRQIDLLKNYHKSVGRRIPLHLNRHPRETEFFQNEIW